MARDKTTAPRATNTGMTNGPAPDPPDHFAVVRRRLWVPALWLWRRDRNRRRSADRPDPLPGARSPLAGGLVVCQARGRHPVFWCFDGWRRGRTWATRRTG